MTRGQQYGTPFQGTATNATSAVVTVSGVVGKTIYVTDISGSSDKAGALILVKDGSTTIWQDRISSTAAYQHSFSTPLKVTMAADLTVTVDGTAIANSNVAGYTI